MSFLLFVIDKLHMVPLEVAQISRRLCTEIRSFTYPVSPQSPSLTEEIDPTPPVGILSHDVVTPAHSSSSPAQRVERLIFVLMKP